MDMLHYKTLNSTTNREALRVSAENTIGMLTARIDDMVGDGMSMKEADSGMNLASFSSNTDSSNTGMASGNPGSRIGVWGSARRGTVHDKHYVSSLKGAAADAMLGADYRFNEIFLAGLALGYENADFKTVFNQGKIRNEAYSVSPYLGARFNKMLSAQVVVKL